MAKKKKNNFDLKNFDTSKILSGNRSYMSLAYGALTVIVIFVIIFLGIRAISDRDNADVTDEAQQTGQEGEQAYIVKEGDSLWTVAEEVYNDGYAWPTIAAANNLESPDAIEAGMELMIPEASEDVAMEEGEVSTDETVTEEEPTVEQPIPTVVQQAGEAAITGGSYTVVAGDHLWSIAVRAYGDGYRWVEIARANNIANPDLIYPDQVFTLPR